MGYRLNRLDEPVFMAVPKPMLTEFSINYRLESCVSDMKLDLSWRLSESKEKGFSFPMNSVNLIQQLIRLYMKL